MLAARLQERLISEDEEKKAPKDSSWSMQAP